MRVKPSVPIGIGIAVAYMALFGGLFFASGVDYDAIADAPENVRDAIVIPLAVAAVVLIVATTVFGWWGPVLRERKRAGGWVIIVPIFIFLGLLAGLDYANLSASTRSCCCGSGSVWPSSDSVRSWCTEACSS